ncbi:MAG TPA: cytochrome c, partial [Bryobacteraceae bacterium]|nr:cytochrome c [Bryobacteraceae bacterium]
MRSLSALVLSLSAASAAPTFHKDVLPVLQRSCQGCHRPGEAAPMSFMSYKETRPWAAAIREAVRTKKMPPWGADSAHGKFANDPSLPQKDIDTLVNWAAGKAPEGDPKHAPAPRQFENGWNIGKPDLVFEMPKPFSVPSQGTLEYTRFILPTSFT